jgi:protein-S-isoprenylcysteine O-methyltransferase Ste14
MAAIDAGRSTRRNDEMKKVLPPTYFLLAIALAVVLHLLVPVRQLLTFPWRLLGLFPLAIGIVLNLLADQAFKKNNTTVKPFERSNILVTGGVFGISRNPMYLGMVLILLAVALLLGSATPFVVAFLFWAVLQYVFVVDEERMLEDTFGDRFRQYRQRVRRWI